MKVEFLPVTIHDSKLQLATGDRGENILQTIRRSSTPLKAAAIVSCRYQIRSVTS